MRIMLDLPLSLCETVEALGAATRGIDTDDTVYCVCTDSREVDAGELFFPLAERREDRILHTRDASMRGAITVGEPALDPNISVKDGRRALLALASLYKSKLTRLRHTVGVTGSAGKTTVRRFISHLLSRTYKVSSTIGNFNNVIGLSLSVLSAPRDTEVLILEMGMNHAGEIAELSAAMRPDVCVITNIGTAHIGNLGSREAIASAKCEIVGDGCRRLLCPADEPLLYGAPHRLTFSVDSPADFSLTSNGELSAFISREGRLDGLRLRLNAEHYKSSLCAAAAAANIVGVRGEALRYGMESLGESECRARILRVGELTVVDDTYNSSYEAAVAMLALIKEYPAPHAAVLGDMLELGDMACELHTALGAQAARVGVDRLIAVGEYSGCIAAGARSGGLDPSRVTVYGSAESADAIAEEIINKIGRGTVLVKGSHATELYRIVSAIKDKEKRDE